MIWVLILLYSIKVLLLVRNSATASIEIPMNATDNISSSYSLMNITENEYSRGIMILESNETAINNYENEGIIVTEILDHDPNLDISDLIMPSSPPNVTCIRRDYNDDIAAIFKEKAGLISTAFIVFNTTYSNFVEGMILNTTELIGLKMLNETTEDCNKYSLGITRRLNPYTVRSLVG